MFYDLQFKQVVSGYPANQPYYLYKSRSVSKPCWMPVSLGAKGSIIDKNSTTHGIVKAV